MLFGTQYPNTKNHNNHLCTYETMTHKKIPLPTPGHLLPQITLTAFNMTTVLEHNEARPTEYRFFSKTHSIYASTFLI